MKKVHTNTWTVGDLVGGFSGAAVALPQSMGLGIVLFAAMGFDAATGAMAGLIGVTILLLISGTVGATTGMISAPNGPMTMLLAGVMGTMAMEGASSDLILLTLSAILICMGLFQTVFALAGGAQLIKYIPYPVIAGLVSGVGLLMIKSQYLLLAKEWHAMFPQSLQESYPFLIALFTALIMYFVPRMSRKKVPGAVGALFGGIGTFYLLLYMLPLENEVNWVVGAIPSISSLHIGFSLESLSSLNASTVLYAALALTVLGTTDSLVTSLVADSKTKAHHNSKKETIAQGISEIIIGLVGGLGGWGTKGATLVAIDAGGRRWSAVMSGLFFLVLILFAGFLGAYLPVSVLAGIVAMVGVGMIDLNIVSWMNYRKTRIDAAVALLVVVVIVSFNLVTAVGIGVLISLVLFIARQSKSPIVHQRLTGQEHHSFCKRSKKAIALLDEYGDAIVMYELKGDLFFATADKLRVQITGEFDTKRSIILHFRRVKYIDLSAMIVLLQISEEAAAKGCELIFCHLHSGLGFGQKIIKAFERIDSNKKFENKVFRDTDIALEYAEERLLASKGFVAVRNGVLTSVHENDFCSKMRPQQKSLIASIGKVRSCKKDEILFDRGEYGDALFLLLQGVVEIRLYTDDLEYKRLAKYEVKTYFGEVSFINPGKRSAQAVATEDCQLFEIDQEALETLNEKDQAAMAKALLYEIGVTLSQELRRSALDIQRLEAW